MCSDLYRHAVALLGVCLFAGLACADPDGSSVDATEPRSDASALDAAPRQDAAGAERDASAPEDASEGDAAEADAAENDAAEADAAPSDAEVQDAAGGDALAPDAGMSGGFPALYPTAIGWNDYVRNDGTDALSSSGTRCNGTTDGPRYDACIHAGEMRAFSVPGRTSCADITTEDSLGAFTWSCDDSTQPVRVVSTRLADRRRLTDLLDWGAGSAGWRSNYVRVLASGQEIHRTAPEIWWPNPVVSSTVAGTYTGTNLSPEGVLDQPGTVYAITGSSTGGYAIRAERIAIAVGPGVRVTSTGQNPAIRIDFTNFGWIEGQVASPQNVGVIVGDSRFVVVSDFEVVQAQGYGVWIGGSKNYARRISVRGMANGPGHAGLFIWVAQSNLVDGYDYVGGATGIRINDARDNIVRNAVLRGSRADGVILNGNAFGNRLVDVQVSDTAGNGVSVEATAHRNTLLRVRTSGNRRSGFLINSTGNTLVDVATSNNGLNGIQLSAASDTRVVGATVVGNGTGGVALGAGGGQVVEGLTVLHSGGRAGLELLNNNLRGRLSSVVNINAAGSNAGGVSLGSGAGQHRFRDLASAHVATYGVYLDNVAETRFDGLLILGGNTTADCRINGGTNPGLAVAAGGCEIQGASTAAVTLGADLSSSLVGPVTTDDAVSPYDTLGAALFASITDWHALQHPHRMWAANGTSIIDAASRIACAAGQTCRIWDLSLRSTDTVLRERGALPTGNDAVTHTWSAATSQACALLPVGATWTGTECQSTFLPRATEIMEDGVGDDDALCESNETCLFLPNLGSYAGHGPLVSAGAFTDGSITGVTLLRHATNGR